METDQGGWNWYAEDIAREPVWRLAANAGYDVAIVHWPVTVAAGVRYRVPEYWRAKDENDKKLERALSTPGLLEDVAREHPDFWSRFNPPEVHDDALTDIATYLLRTAKPTLMLLHLVEVDGEEHQHGIYSPEAIRATENADAQIGRILRELEQDGLSKDTAIVVASDHGFMNVHAMVRPGVALREAGLVTVDGAKVTAWRAAVLVSSAQAYVYLRDPHDEATRKAAHDLFVAKTHDPASGIGRVFEPEEIRALGGDVQAAFALEATPGYALGSGCVGEYAPPSPYKGTHGYDPRRPEMRASLILAGAGVAHGTLVNARLVDVGPTIAGWLGLAMPAADGVALKVTAAGSP
jgi:predicted AlkP superfamily pyrophosphatase or phosphodiesterase